MNNSYTYLALGDSYTVGEGVPLFDGFPAQTVQQFRKAEKPFHAPEIIAKTGWATGELAEHLNKTILNPPYDLVTLLIGVNNQYRGLPPSAYTLEFEQLLSRCVELANDQPTHVFALSIPDWGITPYARGRDAAKVSEGIRLFNNINRSISKKHGVTYIDITSGSPESFDDPTYLCGDGLHPSRKGYARWANMIAEEFFKLFNV